MKRAAEQVMEFPEVEDVRYGANWVQRLPRKQLAAQVRALTAPTPVREIGVVRARLDYRKAISQALVETLRAGLEVALGPTPRRAMVLDPLGER